VSAPVILSPHPDDAVLSLWHVLAAPEPVRVINVFGGSPVDHRGDAWWDRLTGAEDSVARVRQRHAEDRAALAMTAREPENLGFLDGQYRDGEPALERIVDAIAAAAPADAPLLAAAGLDGHRDHRLVRAAALALQATGRPVVLYADVPHATRFGWPKWVTGDAADPHLDPEVFWSSHLEGTGVDLAALSPAVQELDPSELERKRAAVREYRTQVPALEWEFGMLSRPEVLRYEVLWPLS
jgi:LmbE family N-acetylglucosaminyl deacetylase